jgi:hypothetical protein
MIFMILQIFVYLRYKTMKKLISNLWSLITTPYVPNSS